MKSLMACIPKHEFFKFILQEININDGGHVSKFTGPIDLTSIYHKYQSLFMNYIINYSVKDVHIADAEMFSPKIERYVIDQCNFTQDGYWQRIGCLTISNYIKKKEEIERNAIVNHLFLHLGYSDSEYQVRNARDVCRLNETIYLYRV